MASGVLMGSHVAVSAEAIRAGQQTVNRTNKQMASGIIPLTFPSTRAVLWDHRPTGPPAWVHFAHYRNPLVVLEEKSLRLAHHFAEQQPDSTSYRHLLIGSVTCDSDGEGMTVTIDRFAPLKEGRVAQEDVLPGQVLIECTLEKNSAKPTGSVDDLSNSLKTLHRHCTGKTKVDTSDLVILQAYCAYHSNQQNLLFHIDFNMVAPAVKFKVTPVPAVPIVPTALSKNLAGPLSVTDLQAEPKAGYLTMDHTRKLLLVLPSDPKVYTLPLIGIWVSGVSNVHDAFVWSRCLRYHCNHSLSDRVCLAPEPFLVVLYSPLHSQPEFYDCLPSNGSNDLHFELRTCHEVIQMSKLSGPRPDSPVELELVKVESGAKRDMFDAALQTCRDVLTRPAKCELQSSSHLSGSLEDMVPRSTPAPLLTRAPTFRPSVPEVSLLFDENRYVGGKTRKGSLDDNTGKSAANPASAPTTRVPLKQVNRNPNLTQAPPSGKNVAVFPGMHAGPVAPPGSYPVQPYPYMAGFPPNPYGCMPMYGQPMATFPMPPVPYAWNMYNGYSGQPRCPTVSTGPRIRKAPNMRRLETCPSSRQQDGGETQRQQMEQPPHLAKQYHPQNYQHPPASHQQQAATACQLQMATNSGQQNMITSSRTQQMSAASCQQQIAAASCQQQAAAASYQQQAAAALYHSQPVTAIKQDMQQQQQQQQLQQRQQEQPFQQQQQLQQRQQEQPFQQQQQQLQQQQQEQPFQQQQQQLQQRQHEQPFQQQQQQRQHEQQLQQQQQSQQQLQQPLQQQHPSQQQQPLQQQQQQQQQRMLPVQQHVSHVSSMQHQSPILSRQSPVAAVRRADTSSTSASPLSNSIGRDSGMHSSDSADHDSLGTSYDAEASRAPPDVYEILRMQDTQLRLLREQLQQLTARQGVPPGGTAVAAGQQTCSVAINTSVLCDDSGDCGDRHRSSNASETSCPQSQGQTTSLQTSLDTAPSGGQLSESRHDSARHDQTNTSNDTLNLDELRLTQIQDEAESVMSDMIVDMPDYTSLSPEKIRPGSCSTCDCQGSDHCGHFDRSHTSQQDRHSDDSGTDDDRDRDSYECSQTDVSLLLRNQKQFYENLMTNVNKFLGQHTSGEVTDDTVTTVQSESRAGGSIQSEAGARGLEARGNKDSFVDIVENTKRELMKMGVNVDRLNAAEKSYRLDQSSCFMDQLMLPRVNYMSMMLDNDSDLSADADALAMKYLSDEQLTELARLRQHSPMKSRRHGDGLDRVFRGRDMSSCGVSANHMSFASRKYMERYGLLDADSMADDTVTTTPEVLNVGEFLKKLAADKSYLGSVCSHPDDTPANLTRVSYSSDPSPMLGGNLKWSRLSAGVSPGVFHQGDTKGFHGPTSTPADNGGRMLSASSDVTPNRTPEKHRPGYQHHRHRGQPLTVDDHQPRRFFNGQCGEREAKKDFGPYFDGAREAPHPQRKVERVLDIERLKEMPKLM